MKKGDKKLLVSLLFILLTFSSFAAYYNFTGRAISEENSASLNSEYGTDFTDENLIVSIDNDDASQKHVYNWLKNEIPSLILNLPFEKTDYDVSSKTEDYSYYGNDGEIKNALWVKKSGHDGFGAYEFKSEGDSINILLKEQKLDGSFTISVWIKPSSFSEEFSYSEDLTPKMTSASTSDSENPELYSVFENSGFDFLKSNPPYKAFDHGNGVKDYWASKSEVPQWIIFDFGESNEKIIEKYTLKAVDFEHGLDYSPKNWYLAGSNDNLNWNVLDVRENKEDSKEDRRGRTSDDPDCQKLDICKNKEEIENEDIGGEWKTGEKRNYYLNNSEKYRYYLINVTETFGDKRVYIDEIEYMEKIVAESPVISFLIDDKNSKKEVLNLREEFEFSVGDSVISSGKISANQWNHIVAIFDDQNDKIKLYVNGVLEDEETEKNSIAASMINIGSGNFLGFVDDLEIYDSVLSDAQVKLLSEKMKNVISFEETEIGDVWKSEIFLIDSYGNSKKIISNSLEILDFPICGNNICEITETPESCNIDCECITNEECDDGISCTKNFCLNSKCQYEKTDSLCDDGLFCNGAESCDLFQGCISGTFDCDDNLDSTLDLCDESVRQCVHEEIDLKNDSDSDGVLETEDKCPNTPPELAANVNIFGCPNPIAEEFDIKPDFENIDLFNVPEAEIGISGVGKISFLNQNLSFLTLVEDHYEGIDLDSNINLAKNKVFLNSTAIPALNSSALITLSFSNISPLDILRDGKKCFECEIILIDESTNTIVFKVKHFSLYELVNSEEDAGTESASSGSVSSSSGGGSSGGSSGGSGIFGESSIGADSSSEETDASDSGNSEKETQTKTTSPQSGNEGVLRKKINVGGIAMPTWVFVIVTLFLFLVFYLVYEYSKEKSHKKLNRKR